MSDALPPADIPRDPGAILALRDHLHPEPGIDLGKAVWADRPELIGEGWDNTLWGIGRLESAAFDIGTDSSGTILLTLRTPRRRSAIPLLEREARVLRLLAARGMHGVPRLLASAPGALLLPWIPGRSAAGEDAQRLRGLAPQVARLLAELHRPLAPEEEAPAPNPVRGVPLQRRDVDVRAELRQAAQGPGALRPHLRAVVAACWRDGLAAPRWSGAPLLLHGDPHPGNIVLRATTGEPGEQTSGRPTGQAQGVSEAPVQAVLIDLGDATLGDPASDLGALWLLDPSGGALDAYRAARAEVAADGDDAALVRRARAWAARYALALLGVAIPGADEAPDPAGEEDLAGTGLAACARRALAGLAAAP